VRALPDEAPEAVVDELARQLADLADAEGSGRESPALAARDRRGLWRWPPRAAHSALAGTDTI